jgi:integrase
MKQAKKIFTPVLNTIDNDLTARWYIQHYEPIKNTDQSKRVIKYIPLKLNEKERYIFASNYIASLEKKIESKKTFFDTLLDHVKINNRKKTYSSYQTTIKYFTHFLGKKDPLYITEVDILNFKIYLKDRGCSLNTIAKYNNTIHAIYNKAIELNLIDKNIVPKIKLQARSPVSKCPFTDNQIMKLKETIIEHNKQLYTAVQLLFYCFIRPGEMRLLKIKNINFELSYIEIPGTISKNKKTEKVVIPNQLNNLLEYLKNYDSNNYILSKKNEPGSEPVSEKWINTEHRKCLKKCGVIGNYSFYSWKHTGVIKCVQSKMNMRDIQSQLRHHSLDQLSEYLKDLGVMQSIDLKVNYPSL